MAIIAGMALPQDMVPFLRNAIRKTTHDPSDQGSAARYKKQAVQLREQRDHDTYVAVREDAKWLKQAEASAAKWESWRVALSEVVNPVKEGEPDERTE